VAARVKYWDCWYDTAFNLALRLLGLVLEFQVGTRFFCPSNRFAGTNTARTGDTAPARAWNGEKVGNEVEGRSEVDGACTNEALGKLNAVELAARPWYVGLAEREPVVPIVRGPSRHDTRLASECMMLDEDGLQKQCSVSVIGIRYL
jgi:hypothetical protein